MTRNEFLHRVIEDGIVAARADYVDPGDAERLQGSVEGFEACRGKTDAEILAEFERVRTLADDLMHRGMMEGYWRLRSAQAEVEWALNCLSAVAVNEGRSSLLPWLPTARGVFKAAGILAAAAWQPSGL